MPNESDNGFDEWGGYMNAKISKLEEQFARSSDPFKQTSLFAGISIYVNGLTNPSADELKRIMMVHGGTYHHYERSHTTYIIASNLPDVKVRNMNTSKIISPQWVVDCLQAQKILDYTKYLLYSNHKPSQPRITFQKVVKPDKKQDSGEVEQSRLSPDIWVDDEEDLSSNQKEHHSDHPSILAEESSSVKNDNKSAIADQSVTADANSKQARTAVDPRFLSEFYSNSRLHHIATLGAGFKQYISELREKHTGSFPARENLRQKLTKLENFKPNSQTVMHIDMDCFFVSVGLRTHPHLRGQPIAVTHSKGGAEVPSRPGQDRAAERDLFMKKLEKKLHENVLNDKIQRGFEGSTSLSEIASCSYEARKMGVKNGMFVGQALKLCPQLKTIPYDFEGYKEVAYTLYNTIAQYTLNIEAVSCDEMFVDLTELLNDLQTTPMEFVKLVRDEVKEKTGCPCSAGVGGNRLQARMATKKAKPDGQFFLSPDIVEGYMSEIPIADLPGVGYSTSYTLKQLNWRTCGDLQLVPLARIQRELGKKFGETLYQFCRGIDNRPLVYGQVRKSVSAEVNYGIRFKEYGELETFLRQLSTEVHSRLTEIKRKGKCITLKVMVRAKDAPVETSKFMGHGVCDHQTKSVSLSEYTADLNTITRTVLATMKSLNIPPNELRGLGIQISKLDDPNEGKEKKENVIKNMFSKVAEKQKDKSPTRPARPPVEKLSPAKTKQNVEPIKDLFSKVAEKQKEANQVVNRTSLPIPSKSPAKKAKQETKKRGTKSNTKKNTAQTVLGMLQNASVREKPPPAQVFPIDIDPSVLAELPEDIRQEILKDVQRHTKQLQAAEARKQQEIQNRVESVPSSSRAIEQMPTPPPIRQNVFEQKECERIILGWVKSTDKPVKFDINLLAKDAEEFVRAKRAHDLYDPLMFLCRIATKTENCAWHAAYQVVLDAVQKEALLVYGGNMFLKDRLICDKCMK